MRSTAVGLAVSVSACFAVGLTACLLSGCTDKATVDADGPQAPAACLTLGTYGNGSLCDDSLAGRDKCGASASRVCAGGWLCFDDPRAAFCTCKVDTDCTRRAVYINHGRALRKMAPIGATCVAGRCVGLP